MTEPGRLRSDPGLMDRELEAPVSRIADFELQQRLASHDGITSWKATFRGRFDFSKRVLLKVAERGFAEGFDVSVRLTNEARLGMRLSHPNLIATLDLGKDRERLFLVREWVEGLGLRGLLARAWAAGRAIPVPVAVRIAVEVSHVLGYLHGCHHVPWAPQGVVHRAVTPSNILLSTAGEVRLANLFMARAAGLAEGGETGDWTPAIPAYLAPEASRGHSADPRSDLFSLGAVLLECVAGESTFSGAPQSDWKRTRDDQRLAELIDSDAVPPSLRQPLHRCLALRPENRYDTVAELRRDLRQLLRIQRTDGDQELRDLVAELG